MKKKQYVAPETERLSIKIKKSMLLGLSPTEADPLTNRRSAIKSIVNAIEADEEEALNEQKDSWGEGLW